MENTENKQIDSSEKVEERPSPKVKKNIRGNKKARLGVIIFLMIVVAIMFALWEKARIFLAIAFVALLAALGMEVSNKDYDVGQLIKTRSFEQSEVARDESGNVLFDIFGNTTTDTAKGKGADEYNCADFDTQPEAQNFFEKVGGLGNDLHGLDGDKDGVACESLPVGAR